MAGVAPTIGKVSFSNQVQRSLKGFVPHPRTVIRYAASCCGAVAMRRRDWQWRF
jgi:hypothetical protein